MRIASTLSDGLFRLEMALQIFPDATDNGGQDLGDATETSGPKPQE